MWQYLKVVFTGENGYEVVAVRKQTAPTGHKSTRKVNKGAVDTNNSLRYNQPLWKPPLDCGTVSVELRR